MSDFQKERKLVDSLIEKTDSRKIDWNDGIFEDEPWAKIGQHRISIEEGRDANGSVLIFVVIRDLDGKEIDRFNDENLDAGGPPGVYFRSLQTLHKQASRQAKGADQAIEDVLRDIGKL